MKKSIMQTDMSRCYLCGGRAEYYDPLDEHHVFEGALKTKSEKYGLLVRLHHNKCHIFGDEAIHRNAKNNRALKAKAQKTAMEHYNLSVDEWISIFYKNFIEE